VTLITQTFRNDLITLLNTTQMHIYLLAFKDHNHATDGFSNYYYTDIFHDKEGILLDLESIRWIFNENLMGTFYKVRCPLQYTCNYLINNHQVCYLTLVLRKSFESANALIKSVKMGSDYPALSAFQELASQHVDEVNCQETLFGADTKQCQVFNERDGEDNLVLLLLLVTAMNQYQKPLLRSTRPRSIGSTKSSNGTLKTHFFS